MPIVILYVQQDLIQRAFAVVSPTIALQPWSRALAGTDFDTHLLYLRDVEDYRYRLVQALNREVAANKPPPGERYYLADIASITREVAYTPSRQNLREMLARQTPNFAILLTWAALAMGLAGFSSLRLGRLS